MNIFKKIASIFQKKKTDENESWYNNAHEQKKKGWVPPIEGGVAGGSVNKLDHIATNQIAKRNH